MKVNVDLGLEIDKKSLKMIKILCFWAFHWVFSGFFTWVFCEKRHMSFLGRVFQANPDHQKLSFGF